MAAPALFVLGLLLITSVSAQTPVPVTVCILKTQDVTACQTFFNTALPNFTFTCVQADPPACMDKISKSVADIAIFGGDELYSSNKDNNYNLVPILSEDYGLGKAEYYSVAITTKAYCDAHAGSPINLASLKGKKSCHTGFRKTSGWTLPVGYMVENQIAPGVDNLPKVTNDAETVANFFSTVCAPGVKTGTGASAGPQTDGTAWDKLCTGCKGNCEAVASNPYYDYEGAFHCLIDGSGDVAFAKHTTAGEYASDGTKPKSWSTVDKANLRLICPNGNTCTSIDNWAQCNMGVAAAKAVVARPRWADAGTPGAALVAAMVAGGSAFVTAGKAFGTTPGFFSASTVSVAPVKTDFDTYFTASEQYNMVRNLVVPTVRYCTTSAANQAFCAQTVAIMNAKALGATFSCVQFASDDECLAAIRDDKADMRTFDGSGIYLGNKDYDLKVIVGEDYGIGHTATEYFAVAIVNKAMCTDTTTFADLKGMRSCHTGYKKSSGWQAPVGYMLDRSIMPIVRGSNGVADDAQSVASFFSKTCSPRASGNGPMATADKKGTKWAPLCTACKGDCSGSIDNEPYYDYAGSFRCLMEDAGDVSFTKMTIPTDFSKDGEAPAAWSTKNMDDFRLLCPSGGCKPVSQWMSCNIARVAAHGVMVRSGYEHTLTLKTALVAAAADKDFRALVFSSTNNPSDLMFKSSSTSLVPINDDTKTYLGTSLATFQGLDRINSGGLATVAAPPPPAQSDDGSGLSGGAIAGIAIGSAVGAALIAVALTLIVLKMRQPKSYAAENGFETAKSGFISQQPSDKVPISVV